MVSSLSDNVASTAGNDASDIPWDPFADPADDPPPKQDNFDNLTQVIGHVLMGQLRGGQAWDPFADPTEEAEERERQAKAEKAKAKAEMQEFAWEMELEVELMSRARPEEGEEGAVRGVAMPVQCPRPGKPEVKVEMPFGDALAKVVAGVEASCTQEGATAAAALAMLDTRCNPVFSLMQGISHVLFQPEARDFFQAFVDIFVLPEVGLRETIALCFREDPARLNVLFARVFCLLQELLRNIRRALERAAAPTQEGARDCYQHLWTLARLVEADPFQIVLPDVGEEDRVDVQLVCQDGGLGKEPFAVNVALHKDLRVQELKDLLVHRLAQPREIQLFCQEQGGELRALDPDGQLGSSGRQILLHGSAEPRDDDSADLRLVRPILKINFTTGTKMLAELRAKYQEPDFYQEYHDLRRAVKPGGEAMHIQKALTVQSVILPKYGFEGTLRGVMEMRTQVSILTEHDPVMMKGMRDIHKLLDAHQDLPKMPVIKVHQAPRYAVDDTAGWVSHLTNEGFAVIASVADAEQVKQAYDLLWEFLEQEDASSVVRRYDVNTWFGPGRDGQGWAGAADDGIIQGRGIGQSEVLWFLRGLPTVRKVFATLWGTEHLVTSFDGAGVFRPYGIHRDWKITKKNWYHLDQAHFKRGLHCVQGLVTLKDATEETGGLVVVPRSHRFHNDVCRHYTAGDTTSDFLSIDVNDRILTEGSLGPRMVAARAGDLIIWDSRTIHCNTAPLRDNRELLEGNDLVRAVCYICMTPAAWCSEETLRRRKQAFKDGVTTAHWPHEYHPKNSRTSRPSIQLRPEQHQLISPFDGSGPTGGWRDSGTKPGAMSFLPPKQFRVAKGEPEFRGSPTFEWGSAKGSLRHGDTVQGYVIGEWLRLICWRSKTGKLQTASQPEDESWAYMGDATTGSCAFEACYEADVRGG